MLQLKHLVSVFGLLLVSITPLAAQTFTFDNDTEGGSTNADGSDPVWEPTGGNPGGWISAFDISTGGTWHWIAPPTVLGNTCASYGLKLSFDIKTSQQVTNNTKPDIVLKGDGIELVFNTQYDPLTFWTNYQVVLKEDAGWRIGTVNGAIPTKQQFINVLQNLEELRIRGEYLQQDFDDGGLDNVVLETTSFDFDLDKNDSTTPPNSKDFVNDTSCTDGASICDIDLQLLSESPIDSVVIQLLSTPNGSQEFLTYELPLPALGPLVNGADTKKIVLVNNGQSLASFFREAMKKITYRNTAFPAQSGVRLVGVSVYTPCGPLGQAIVRIPFFPPAYAGEDGAVDFCPSDAASDLKNYLDGPFAQNGYWSPALTDSSMFFDPKTDKNRIFQYITPSTWAVCPNDTAVVTVRVATPLPNLGADTVLCRNKTLRLSIPLLPEYSHWAWSTGASSGSILVTEAGIYSITVTSEINNCTFTDDITVEYVNCEECNVYVPNVFSPDDDGQNDHFQGFSNCDFLKYHLRIFDRWGNMVFETQDSNTDWDGDFRGKNMAPGVFVWLLDYETEFLGKPLARRMQGDVTIIK